LGVIVLAQPAGSFINQIPGPVFIAIHTAAFLIGAYLAYRCFQANQATFAWGFTLFTLAEISYITYHLDWTVFLFAHTISEVLDLLAFVIIFGGLAKTVLRGEGRA
jgi:hypothetical protein